MKYPKIKSLSGNTPNQRFKFRIKICVDINDDAQGTYKINSQIKFKISMLKSSLFDYINAHILAKGAISIAPEAQAKPNNNVKEILFKSSALFTDCISEINNAQLDNAKNINVAMPMYDLIEYSNNYSKTSESLWK